MRTIPLALQTHLDQDGTTLCFLLKVTARDGTIIAVTTLDQDVTYDDGTGERVYSAAIGADAASFDASADLDVDNSEATMLLADSGDFTQEKIDAGVLDYADFVMYRVNWQSLTAGEHIIIQRGRTGAVRAVEGLAGVVELRGLSQILKQNFINLYSLTCRVKFGSIGPGAGSCGGGGGCGFDAESLWQSHSVASVGSETDRIFTANSTPAVSGPNGALTFAPGLVKWLTGSNAGRYSEVEAITGAVITLRFGTPYAIQAADTFEIRPDCDKSWSTCKDDYDNALNFRGEPLIPITDGGNQTPGALAYPVFPGLGGVQDEQV